MPSYYLLQNNEHHKPSAHAPSEIPLGSFAFLQSNGYPKQNTESNFEISLSNLDEKEYLQSPSNFAPSRSAIIGLEKHNPSLYEPFRLTDSMFANIELDHNSW
ncbi:PREDICTED: uncharacterized protein LOC105359614 [Ceratosolen solmsi marchali]|uniref:Uncharacterized protein LOC105359614 n=1 Tax=Ceratosolen solmsi marchali TaxID=326594 RepID=A0AAJ6VM90_9HYME|nr:PREDICTED: uncharacterized protein LOC105359614 [Ceratosolen solmsi marchali]